MAEKKNSTYESIMRDLRAHKYAPVYCMVGDEPYYINLIIDYMVSEILTPEERDFNMTMIYGQDASYSQVVEASWRYPMMSKYQLVVVREAQGLSGDVSALEKYLQKPQPSTILVLAYKSTSAGSRKLLSAAGTIGVLFESRKLRDRDLPGFIERYCKERGVGIDVKSSQMIADSVGSDLSRLAGELNKLILSLSADEKTVTPDVVEKQIGISKDFNAFELRNAIVNRQVYKANLIMKYFNDNPKAGNLYSFLPLLFNYFQNLMIAYYCPQKGIQEAVAQWLELKSPWAAKDYLVGMRNYSGMKVMQIISKIRELDAKSKGVENPNTPQEELMKELIFFILH